MMRVYIAGPMTGYDNLNFDAFDRVAEDIREAGCQPVSPADLTRICEGWGQYPPEDADHSHLTSVNAIRRDLDSIMGFTPGTDAIYMLKGWEDSKGALVEHALAIFLGLRVIYEKQSTAWDGILGKPPMVSCPACHGDGCIICGGSGEMED